MDNEDDHKNQEHEKIKESSESALRAAEASLAFVKWCAELPAAPARPSGES